MNGNISPQKRFKRAIFILKICICEKRAFNYIIQAQAAAQAVMRMNPDLKVEAQNNRVGEDTQNIYTDEFMESLDGVANALDNGKLSLFEKFLV